MAGFVKTVAAYISGTGEDVYEPAEDPDDELDDQMMLLQLAEQKKKKRLAKQSEFTRLKAQHDIIAESMKSNSVPTCRKRCCHITEAGIRCSTEWYVDADFTGELHFCPSKHAAVR
jgi:hypothetical protein